MPYNSDDLMRLVQGDHTDTVTALEQDTAATAIGDLDDRLTALIATATTAWTAAFGAPDAPGRDGTALRRLLSSVRTAVRAFLDQLGPRARSALSSALADAVALGARQGADFVRAVTGARPALPSVRVGRVLADAAARLPGLVADRRDQALALLAPGRVGSWDDLVTGLGAAKAAATSARAHITVTLGQAVGQGLDAVTDSLSAVRLWVAEADACVRCLAYTGRTAPVGVPFPGGLSWDPRQRVIGAPGQDGPPLHPFCRCRCVAWRADWPADGVPFPLALQREAHRSIGYGTRLGHESGAARLRAARELLRTEPGLLPAVEARARAALRAGRFAVAA